MPIITLKKAKCTGIEIQIWVLEKISVVVKWWSKSGTIRKIFCPLTPRVESTKGVNFLFARLRPEKSCIFRPSESKETVGVSPPSREKQVQVHGRESTGVLFWKEMAKERFAKRSSACHLFRLESFSLAHGVISIDEDLVGTVLNPVQHSIC